MISPERACTFKTYEDSAQQLSDYFEGMGPRIDDIEKAIEICPNPDSPKVLELGCGDGRDAVEIAKRSSWYLGVDTSHSMIDLASQKLNTESFEVADMTSLIFPPDLDVIYAFASMLHLNKSEVEDVLVSGHESLNVGGIFFISLKFAPEYTYQTKTDQFGSREFFFYSPDEIVDAGEGFTEVYRDFQKIGETTWFTIALQKCDAFQDIEL